MRSPRRAIGDPAFQKFDLRGLQRFLRSGRRHQQFAVVGRHAGKQLRYAVFVLERRPRACFGIEPQVGFARAFIGPVALVAVVRKNGSNVARERERFVAERGSAGDDAQGDAEDSQR